MTGSQQDWRTALAMANIIRRWGDIRDARKMPETCMARYDIISEAEQHQDCLLDEHPEVVESWLKRVVRDTEADECR